MGKIQLIGAKQKNILDRITSNSYLCSNFYFTGTALSYVYLKHRESIDIDLFSKEKLDTRVLFSILEDWSKDFEFKIVANLTPPVYRCELKFKDNEIVKVDFAYYPYILLQNFSRLNNLNVDSKFDIAVNKLLSLT